MSDKDTDGFLSQVESTMRMVRAKQDELQKVRDEHTRTREQLDEACRLLEDERTQRLGLQKQSQEREEELARAKEEASTAQSEVKELRERLHEAEETRGRVETQCQEATSREATVSSELSQANSKVQQLQSELETTQTKWADTQQKLEELLNTLSQEREAAAHVARDREALYQCVTQLNMNWEE